MSNETQITLVGAKRSPNRRPSPEFADAIAVSRFWRLVETGEPSQCWPWRGDTDKAGYGVFFFHGKKYGAHELALSFTTGEKRTKHLVNCHSCDNPGCVNPFHLRFDTPKSNVDDMYLRGRNVNPSAKLTEADVVAIRERRANGARQKDLADQYGVTDGTISMLVRGERWKDVGGPIEKERAYCRD